MTTVMEDDDLGVREGIALAFSVAPGQEPS